MSEQDQAPPRCEFDTDKLVIKLNEVVLSDVTVIDGTVGKITGLIKQSHCCCSGLYLLIGMTRFSSKWILSYSTWYKFSRSGHFAIRRSSLTGQAFLGGTTSRAVTTYQ
jgi:hypothetical protein